MATDMKQIQSMFDDAQKAIEENAKLQAKNDQLAEKNRELSGKLTTANRKIEKLEENSVNQSELNQMQKLYNKALAENNQLKRYKRKYEKVKEIIGEE